MKEREKEKGKGKESESGYVCYLDHQSGNKEVGVTWSADVVISVPREIHYRYFIGRRSPKFEDRVIIVKWEAFLTPRSHHINKPTKVEEKVDNAGNDRLFIYSFFFLLCYHQKSLKTSHRFSLVPTKITSFVR